MHRQVVLGRDGRDLREVLRREDAPSAPVVGVLEADDARWRVVEVVVVVRRQVDGGPQRVEGQRAVGMRPHRVKHHAPQRRRRPVLVVIDVRLVAQDDLAAAAAVRQQRGEVAHRAARDEDRGLLARHPGGQRLQPVHGRIVAEHIVTHLRRRHGLAHGRSRDGHGVASQVDPHDSSARGRQAPARPSYATRGRGEETRPCRQHGCARIGRTADCADQGLDD